MVCGNGSGSRARSSTTPLLCFSTSRRSGSTLPVNIRFSASFAAIAKSREATVVLSTHLLPEVEEVCSKVVILNHGRVVASGSVGEVIRTALIEQSAELRVPLDLIQRARQVLSGFSDLTIDQIEEQPGVLKLAVGTPGNTSGAGSNGVMNAALTAVTAAGIPVLRFELEGARLSDAFLKMTSEAVA